MINFNPAHGISFEDDTEFGKDIKHLHLDEFGKDFTSTFSLEANLSFNGHL